VRLSLWIGISIWLAWGDPAGAQTITVQDVPRCAWLGLPAEIRQEYLAAYHRSSQDAMLALGKRETLNLAAVADCADRSDIPAQWARTALASRVLQQGAANELAAMTTISTDMLDAAWEKAPPAATQCALANAAKLFGIETEPCPDGKAPLWFLEELEISPQTNRAAAEQALTYFNAKAQGIWAATFIAKFKEMKR
jgi:hypothetical protein